ncbi:MAG: TonB-dependent receptor [Bacteroidales bacterium]|nr:TonB-dependent receptor [Bacteroidales bacterium]
MKRIIIPIVSVLLPLSVFSQNLNPEVQVTNEYQTRLDDVSKQGPEMVVPDSLLRFDYHFDYSVFDSPYKGAYEFSPYSVIITPDPKPYDGRKLYLSGGAGYTLRPEFDAVWAAIDRKRFALNVFGSANGFLGQYRSVAPGIFALNKDTFHEGYDFRTAVGVDARFNLGKVGFLAEVGYDGVYTYHEVYHRDNCHAPYAQLRFGFDNGGKFAVSGGANYRFVQDWRYDKSAPVTDHEVLADVTLSVRPVGDYRINTDIYFVTNSFYTGGTIRPHAIFQLGVFDIDAGLRLGWVADKFTAHPDITAKVHLLNDYLQIYAGAVGQDHYTMYWQYKNQAHHYYIDYAEPRAVREIADLYLGLDGHAKFGLQYDIKAGYRFLQDAPFWAVSASGLECLSYQDLGMFHADLALSWASERVNLDGGAHFVKVPEDMRNRVFEPALVTVNLKGSYNWMKRIYAGLSVDFATDRYVQIDAARHRMPGYVNVGLWGEYRLNKRLSFWLKGYNILNHDVRISPLYSEVGPSVTVGATFSL